MGSCFCFLNLLLPLCVSPTATHSQIMLLHSLKKANYQLPLLITDSGVPPLSNSTEVKVQVCVCKKNKMHCSSAHAHLASLHVLLVTLLLGLLCKYHQSCNTHTHNEEGGLKYSPLDFYWNQIKKQFPLPYILIPVITTYCCCIHVDKCVVFPAIFIPCLWQSPGGETEFTLNILLKPFYINMNNSFPTVGNANVWVGRPTASFAEMRNNLQQ